MRSLARNAAAAVAALLFLASGCLEAPPDGSDAPSPPVTGLSSVGRMASDGLAIIASGGYLNGQSFQQDGILTHQGFQYSAFWNAAARVVLVRRPTGEGPWEYMEVAPGYAAAAADAQRTISLGVSLPDGRLHIAFDNHDSELHYVASVAGMVTAPGALPWDASSFGPVLNALGTEVVAPVTYPRFVTAPGGRMLLSHRSGSAAGGDEVLWEYDGTSAAWLRLGSYIAGNAADGSPLMHGLEFQGTRLHAAWSWQTGTDPAANRDLLHAFSDDFGRTWRNSGGRQAGITGARPITIGSDVRVGAIGIHRGLMHQEHMVLDHAGRVHVLLSHLPDQEPDDADFASARTKTEYFHYWRDTGGTWTRRPMQIGAPGTWRGKLAVSSRDNLYAVLPNIRLASASASAGWENWALIDVGRDGLYFSDPLIDRAQLRETDRLTIYAPGAAVNGQVPIFTITYRLF